MIRWKQIIGGILSGIILMEVIFSIHDEWSFPHVNIYQNHPEFGVILQSNASQYLKIHSNPRTFIQTNERGYRGEHYLNPQEEEIIIVGDSQVFGLGVEESETFSAQLQKQTGRPVLNAGIPTYGPIEYTEVAKNLIRERKPKTLIYTINLVNDLFEYNRPNTNRHEEWDGWAVRKETAPSTIFTFPGKKWLFQKSHLVYAIRKYLRYQEAVDTVSELPSEGLWEDLLDVQAISEHSDTTAYSENQQKIIRTKANIKEIHANVKNAMEAQQTKLSNEEKHLLKASEAKPGDVIDIVRDQYIEEGRPIIATTEMIQQGLRFRASFMEKLRVENQEEWQKITKMTEEANVLNKQKRELIREWTIAQNIPSNLFNTLKNISIFCTENNVELVILILPIDVQVSEAEWKKYPYPPQDMSFSLPIIDELIKDAQRIQRRVVNPLSALRSIQPAGFLDGDIHMDPKGHEQVAKAIAETVQSPMLPLLPEPGIPAERTWVPSLEEWEEIPFSYIPDQYNPPSGCQIRDSDEWIHIRCQHPNHQPSSVTILGDNGESMKAITKEGTTIVAPLLQEKMTVEISWEEETRTLEISRSQDEISELTAKFTSANSIGKERFQNSDMDELCACFLKDPPKVACPQNKRYRNSLSLINTCTPHCGLLFFRNIEICVQETTCQKKLDCAMGVPWALPNCPLGQVNAGGNGTCLTLCDENNPCTSGTCQEWQGTGVCY